MKANPKLTYDVPRSQKGSSYSNNRGAAVAKFKEWFEKKTGNAWDDRANFRQRPMQYNFVELSRVSEQKIKVVLSSFFFFAWSEELRCGGNFYSMVFLVTFYGRCLFFDSWLFPFLFLPTSIRSAFFVLGQGRSQHCSLLAE
jgi:hypothetical protein